MARIKTATRTVTNAGRLRVLVAIASKKAVGELPAESLVEYDGILELLWDPDVLSVEAQPETFTLYVDGIRKKYTPDVRFVRRDGRIGYREFKLSKEDLDDETRAELEAARQALEVDGFEFEVRDASEIRRGFFVDNLRLLKRYAEWPTSDAFQRRVWEFVGHEQTLPLQDLRDFVGGAGFGALYRMLWDQQLHGNLTTTPLCAETPIRRGVL